VSANSDLQFGALERAPTLSDRVTDRVLTMISTAALRPGDRLPSERDLAARFGVSRTVVREALRSLAAKGVLDVRTGSGAIVARVDAERASEALRLFMQSAHSQESESAISYEQINDVREMIETRVTRIAAQLATDEDLEGLRQIHAQFESVPEDPEAASRLDVAFHRAIAASTHNPLYLIMLDSIEPVLLDIRRRTLSVSGRPTRAASAHATILKCLVEHDAPGAEQAMEDHLQDSRAVWRQLSDVTSDR
jgi:DNA-binding FadR family transcriptional regulator